MARASACPCGSGKPFVRCCQPYLQGEKLAGDAQSLMRSRYCAYTTQQHDYLLQTWHPDTRPEIIEPEPEIQWQRLQIIKVIDGSANDESGIVEFIAHYKLHGRAARLHETSRFRQIAGRWYYLDGELHNEDKPRAKISRNAAYPCGSGKKYKRCCGQ